MWFKLLHKNPRHSYVRIGRMIGIVKFRVGRWHYVAPDMWL